jgi:hypothetical protein
MGYVDSSRPHKHWHGLDSVEWDEFSGQYPPEISSMYEKIETTPDDLLLWFHHVPYTQKLQPGKSVIQHFYDAHYAGAATAQTFPRNGSHREIKSTERDMIMSCTDLRIRLATRLYSVMPSVNTTIISLVYQTKLVVLVRRSIPGELKLRIWNWLDAYSMQ